MEPFVTRQGVRRIIIITVALIVCLAAYYPFSPAAKQAAEIRKAQECDAYLNARLVCDPRFQQVTVFTYTADIIALDVVGTVTAREDSAALELIVADAKPPVGIRWFVSLPSTAAVIRIPLTGMHERIPPVARW